MAETPPQTTSSSSPVQARWLTREQQRSWRAYLVGTTLLKDRLDRNLRNDADLSLAEYEVLVRLSEAEGRRLRMAVLADSLSHSRSRITHTITRLEKAGLVERSSSVDDGRGVEAMLTDKGFAVLEAAAPGHVADVREFLVDLADDADLEAVGRVFSAIIDKLGDANPGMDHRP